MQRWSLKHARLLHRPRARVITISCTPSGRSASGFRLKRSWLFFGGRRHERDIDAESHYCTIDSESIGVVAAVRVVTSRSSALGRLRCEPPELANVGRRRCCIAGRPPRGGPSQGVSQFRSCWVEVRVAVVRPFRFGRPRREQRDGGRKEVRARSKSLRVEVAVREARDRAVPSRRVQRCGRTTHGMALPLKHVVADLRSFSVLATAEGVRRYMDALIGNVAPNSEAEKGCRQEIRDYSLASWNVFDLATIRADAWSSDEQHEPVPH